MISQGDIFDYDFGGTSGHVQAGRRPAVVVQTDVLNHIARYDLTIISPLSSKGRQSLSHVRIEPTPENGLTAVSFVKCEQVFTVPRDRLERRRGKLASQDLDRVRLAIADVFDIFPPLDEQNA